MKTPCCWSRALGYAVLVFFFGSGMATAAAPPNQTPSNTFRTSGGPYCGIYGVFAAARALGKQVSFEELVDSQYITSHLGSRPADLEAAAQACGLHGKSLSGLTAASLRSSPYPLLLHMRLLGKDMPYSHWVLFLGCEGDGAQILDPPHPVDRWSLAEVLALWDGVGVALSREPIASFPLAWAPWMNQALVFLLVGSFLFILRMAWVRWNQAVITRIPLLGQFYGCLWLILLGCGLGWCYDRIQPEGLSHNPPANAYVIEQHFTAPMPEISLAEARELAGQPNVTFLDARLPRAYAAGHLPHAVNLPIASGRAERERVLTSIPANHKVIAYCQSKQCTWGHIMASHLSFRGHPGVAIYPGGWNEWHQHQHASQP